MSPLDESRLEALLSRQGWVNRLARRLAASDGDADDLVQEACLTAWKHPPRDPDHTGPWLARILKQAAARARKADRKRAAREQSTTSRTRRIPTPAEVTEREEARRRVVRLVLDLEEPHRSVILLRYFEELPLRDVARALEVPLETARTRLRRAMAELRRRAGEEEKARGLPLLAPLCLEAATAGGVATAQVGLLLPGAVLMSKKFLAVSALLLAVLLSAVLWRWPWRETPPERARSGQASAAPVPEPTRSPSPRSVLSGEEKKPGGDDETQEPVSTPGIIGTVLDPLGAPVEGARVVSLPGWVSKALVPEEIEPDLEANRRALTDSRGSFLVSAAGDQPVTTLLVDTEGYPAHLRSGVRAGDSVTIRLHRPLVLAGRVLDARSVPVPGAIVSWTDFDFDSGVLLEKKSVAGDDGSYRLSPLPGVQEALVRADAEGYAPTLVSLSRSQMHSLPPSDERGEKSFDLVLIAGATLRGRIVDAETGAPIPGFRVRFKADTGANTGKALPRGGFLWNPSAWIPLAEKTTDEEGHFAFHHLPAEGHHIPPRPLRRAGLLRLDHPDYFPIDREIPRTRNEETLELSFSTHPSVWVTGRVLREDGEPIARAEVFHREALGVASQHGDTDETGRYRLRASRAFTTITLLAQTPDSRMLPPGWARIFEQPVTLEGEGETTAPDILIPREPTATIAVRDAEDRPVWGAIVEHEHGHWRGATDREGGVRYVWAHRRSLEPPVAHRLKVTTPGFLQARTEEILPSLSDPPVSVIVLERGRDEEEQEMLLPDAPTVSGITLAGRVLDEETGEPILNYSVAVRGAEKQRALHTTPGSFRIEGLSPGNWILTVRAEGYVDPADVEVEIEDDVEPQDASFLLSRGARVRGRVLLPLDLPPELEGQLTQTNVCFSSAGGASVRARLDADGAYEATGLSPGTYRVTFVASISGVANLLAPRNTVPLQVPGGATDIHHDLEAVLAGGLFLHVSRDPESGLPTNPVEVFSEGQEPAVRIDSTVDSIWQPGSDRGGYRLYLAPGRYVVRTEDESQTVVVVSGEHTVVELP